MEIQGRRATDALRAVDGVVDSYLRHSNLGGRRIANLAATIAIENSGAGWGSLLLNDGEGLNPTLAIQDDLTAADAVFEGDDETYLRRAEDTAELVVAEGRIAAPIVLDGRVKGVLYLRNFDQPPSEAVQKLANSVATRIASLLKNAELLEALDRTKDDIHALAQLSESFAAGQLGSDQLEETVIRATSGTRSDGGVIGLFSREGRLDERFTTGFDGQGLIDELLSGEVTPEDLSIVESGLPGSVIFEPLSPDVLHRRSKGKAGGFLAVYRDVSVPYRLSEGSFIRAIANLLSGALARRDYFRQASEDALTSTGSRFALQLELAEAEARSLKTGLPFTILLADIDQFKEINDDYGHLVGDEVLKDVAEVLRCRLRSLDSVSRYGGDEFVVLLPDTRLEPATGLAQELRELVEAKSFAALADSVTISMGVAEYGTGHTAAETLRRADLALYQSKQQGRNRVTQYSSDLE
ncbi:MAG: diguanylate cyclase [Thermoanaerobaculia bacterium]